VEWTADERWEVTKERVIEAFDVRKNYAGGTEGAGLNGFDLEVNAGTVTGLLGPNGAGKTTAVRILATLLRMDSGEARIAGYDVSRQGAEVRRSIGLVGQYAAVDEILTGKQNLVMFGRLNHLGHAKAVRRADELLERFSLTESAALPASKYSGGMRRRLDLAASLIVAPAVLFVDEPTTGLDPAGRAEVWSAVRELVKGGTTVLLTTQYLDEADQLADRISMLKAGKVVAEGTPDALKAQLGADWLDLVLTATTDVQQVLRVTDRLKDGETRVDGLKVSIPVKDRTRALIEIATLLQEAKIEPADVTLRRPTLDEVFLHLTGTGVPA
jgi:ABC-2 type transport system ATP-binding protein